MVDLNDLSRAARSAAMRGGTAGWGQVGSEDHVRYMEPMSSTSRRRCSCGCKRRATHLGMTKGVGLCSGCEMKIRRWVKDGDKRHD
ncbi:hypothetical protein F7R06_01150 [Pseudomonas moorei]|nr:hypothetical protein F7R06_01150 [Pseudomonas moorei]